MSANHEHPNPNPHDDPDSSGVALVGFVGALQFVFVVVVVAALCYRTNDRLVDDRVYGQPTVAVAQLHAGQEAGLYAPEGEHVVNEATGQTARHVPLDRAIQLAAVDMTQAPAPAAPAPPPAPEADAPPAEPEPSPGGETTHAP